MTPKVSVVVPVYNAEDYLGQCLDTILLQSLQDIEVICVDDGSSDGSLGILQTYAMFDERVKVIQQENSGAPVARNRGLKEAIGKYVIFFDNDDFFEENMLERMVAKIETDGSDFVACGYRIFDEMIKEKTTEHKIKEKYLKKSPFSPEDFSKELLLDLCAIAPWVKLVRRDFLIENNIVFDENVRCVDDIPFHVDLLVKAKKISVLEDCFVNYRWNVPTQFSKARGKHFVDLLKTLSLSYRTLKEGNYNKYFNSFTTFSKSNMQYDITECSKEQERENLMAIRKELSPEFFDMIFKNDNPVDVSIIIPVYNMAEFLPKCLDSCLNQTLQNIEIICVDDGSTDNSLEILNQYAEKDKRITVIHQENQRQAIARNKAMEVATGAYIQFVDADDWLEPDTCECLYLYCRVFDLEMCQFNAIHFGKKVPGGEIIDKHLNWLPENAPTVFNKNDLGDILPQLAVAACFTFYSHAFLTRNNIHWINKKIPYEDTPFFIEAIFKAKRVGALNIPFYHRSRHDASTVGQLNTNMPEYMEIVKYTLEKMTKWTDKEMIARYCVRFLGTVLKTYSGFESTDKVKIEPHFYDFCFWMQKQYCLKLPAEIYAWCTTYLEKRDKKEKIKFYLYRWFACCVRNQYSLTLLSVRKKPFCIKVLGIPVVYIKKSVHKVAAAETKDQITRRDMSVKLFGITIFKTQKEIKD